VGKTELARALADTLFGSGQNLIRLDMSEYMEPHNVARLIGSPPGYIGHDEEGQLTGKLRKTPHALVLLDEIEKADPKVLDLFLQVFDEGRITDSKGKTIDAKNAVFIMTSNLGSKAPAKRPAALGFNAVEAVQKEDGIHEDVKKHFRTEMINRIDEVIRFNSLTEKALAAIANDMLGRLTKTIQDKHQITLTIDAGVVDVLCKKAESAEFGARNLRRVIQDEIELPVIELLGGAPVDAIRCRAESDAIVVEVAGKTARLM
jgi:ATP-dependent Clp protease ATP-binding subunit ClpC